MKIVFSRKGFDSQYGGVPSPVFPDGTMLSLPIPTGGERSRTRYGDLRWKRNNVGAFVESLTGKRKNTIRAGDSCHLDPDLDRGLLPRPRGWKPAFGQVNAAQGHLRKQDVGPGDLFLFFGWFRDVRLGQDGIWRYDPDAPGMHRIFGWLQVGDLFKVGNDIKQARQKYPGLAIHPHFVGTWNPTNTIYVAADRLAIPGLKRTIPGGGCFTKAHDALLLTDQTQAHPKRSVWRLPGWFLPPRGRPAFSYHTDRSRWSRDGDQVLLQTVAKGQEFVLDTNGLAQTIPWLRQLFREGLG